MRWFAVLLALGAGTAEAGVLKVAELNTDQIRALDPANTAVILPGGILEQHGPYLPSYTDGYGNERMARDLAERSGPVPAGTRSSFPPIPLGSGGANEIGGRFSFPGSYTYAPRPCGRSSWTSRPSSASRASSWVFVVHGHGSPQHNRALDDASDILPRHVSRADGAPGSD